MKIKKDSNLAKKCLIFGFEDVLIPGNIDKNVKMKNVSEILKNLKKIEELFPRFRFFAATGYSADEALKRIEKYKLREFFPEDRIFFVNKEYLAGREEIDRKLYEQKITENKEFKDEYFKQVTIQAIQEKFGYTPEEMVFIGHDLWTEGYYTFRFSKIDFALLKNSHSCLGECKNEEIKNLTYIDRTWGDLEKLIKGEFPKPDYALLEKFVFSKMKEKLFEGTKLGALSRIAGS